MTTQYILKPFQFNINDLNFIRDQIAFRPLFDMAGNAIVNWNGMGAIYDAKGVQYISAGLSADAAIAKFGSSYISVTESQGLRDVTGANNNLVLVNKFWGAVDQPFLQTVAPDFSQYIKPLAASQADAFYAQQTFGSSNLGPTDYLKTAAQVGGAAGTGDVVDYTPRMISRIITTGGSTPLQDDAVLHPVDGGQVLHWSASRYLTDLAYKTVIDAKIPTTAGLIEGAAITTDPGILAGGQHDPQDPGNGELFFGAVNPGVAPGNSWLAYFGQFFDHGLDFIDKGAGLIPSKITIPLALDDPLYRAPNTNFVGDPGNTKITVSRASVSGFDAAGGPQWINHSSPYIDQSQTYGSSAQVTELLRKWVSTDHNTTFHPGAELFDGHSSASWTNAWGELTTATLPTLNELRAHLVATGRDDLGWADVLNLRNRDATGHVATDSAAGNSGQALLLDMNPHFDTKHFSAATVTALSALGIQADAGGNYALGGPGSLGSLINFATFDAIAPSGASRTLALNVLIESVGDHYVAGDGRSNENIGLTAIHHVFHEEHNYQVRNIEKAILVQDTRAVTLGDSSHSIAHDWQVVTSTKDASGNYTFGAGGTIAWDDSKIFSAAKLTVEMEYQHAAVDQYARTITPDLPEFVGYNSGENASVSLEYAQAAFRFGHSTMRETIDFMDPTGGISGKVMSVALEQAFLNPALFAEKGAAAIAMGMTHQQMNEVDELLTPAMNQGLLGQPLDLAAINIARGRDIGLPTLNEFREAVGLSRYMSWADFGQHMVHAESLVNFIAAYSFDGNVAKAQAILDAEAGAPLALQALLGLSAAAATEYASGFLNGNLAIAGADGFNHIDTWIGGLAEVHVTGGLLGETFNLVFVDQINRLMDGDRFYYLYRLDNLNLGDEIANAQFKDIIERNTGLQHLNGSAFAYADQYYELSGQVDAADTTGSFQTDHKYADALAAHPTLGIYSTGGTSTVGNGTVSTISGKDYLLDIRAAGAYGNANVNGSNLDGAPDTGADASEVLVATDRADLLNMGGNDDTAYAEGGDDLIYGGGGIDRLYGGNGRDTIYGGDMGDLIDGGAGDDTLYGDSSGSAAAGVDQIIGGDGDDLIYGGVGIDKLSGGRGDDVIFGGNDTDAFTHGGDGNDYIDGQSDGDVLWGDGGDDLVVGGDNQDIVAGLNGDDILRPGNPSSASGGGPDEVMGGDGASDVGNDGKGIGFDLIDFSDYPLATAGGMNADFATQSNPVVAINGTTPFPAWVGIEGLIGTANNDTVVADDNANWLFGGGGNDTLVGAGGNDIIVGDGVRLDTLIGSYTGSYTNEFDGASHRAIGFIQASGLIDAAGPQFDKHFTEMLKSAMFKDLELGGSTIRELQVNGVAVPGSRTGDGGTAGSDTVVFVGNRADYTVTLITITAPNGSAVSAFKIQDNGHASPDPLLVRVAGDGTDLVMGVESFRFADKTLSLLQMTNYAPTGSIGFTGSDSNVGSGSGTPVAQLRPTSAIFDLNLVSTSNPSGAASIAAGGYNWQTSANGGTTWSDIAKGNGANQESASDVLSWGTTSGVLVRAVATYADDFGQASVASAPWNLVVGSGANGNSANNTLSGTASLTVADAMFGLAGNDVLNAGLGDDFLYGGVGIDTLNGGDGNDYLDGGDGNDSLLGGMGNDTYLVDSASDLVSESAGAGTDVVLASVSYSLNTTSAIGVENLTLTGSSGISGTGNALDNAIVGNGGANTLDGGAGADTLAGGAGNDTYVVDSVGDVVSEGVNAGTDLVQSSISHTLALNVENLLLTGTVGNSGTGNGLANLITGNSGANLLSGLDGNDTLDGGTGADTLAGGVGDDSYVVDNVGDVVTEGSNAGTDLVQSSVGYTLPTNLENLTLTGTAAISGTGNTLNNVITGNSGANTLNGGSGADTLAGGIGNDTYVVDNVGDVVTEGSNAGTDLVQSSVSYTLALNIENLSLTGSSAISGTGNDLGNLLIGNSAANLLVAGGGNDSLDGGSGNDSLTGGLGTDTLTGGAGSDRFVYTDVGESAVGVAVRDTINDFVSRTDNLDLSAIDANTAINGNQAFSSIAAGNTFTAAGQLRYHYETVGGQAYTIVEGNVDTNLAADFQVALVGTFTFTAAGDITL